MYLQGLEGYSQEPGIDQNTVWESGNNKYLDGIQDLTVPCEGGVADLFACLLGIWEMATTQINVP